MKYLKYWNILIAVIIILLITYFIFFNRKDKEYIMLDFSKYSKEEMISVAKENEIVLNIEYKVDNLLEENTFVSQSIEKEKKYDKNTKLTIVLSKKEEVIIPDYASYKVNELGLVPIMMYHGIHNMKSDDTKYIGGNVDKDGYNRTTEAFINDLEMYYKSGYRMVRLIDYINGNINVKLGYSPIILTFDDGNKNNINILGKDDKGNLIIDPNCAVGILESFKSKYPDYNVTATFSLNKNLFVQNEYNEDILKWLVNNGYDIGNHTKDHVDFTKVDSNDTQMEVAYMYKLLDQIIPSKYVQIVALPYGSPYTMTHSNFNYIVNGEYEGYKYTTEGMLRVGWDSNPSPFHKDFNPLFMKRVRAYDNDGKEFDIASVFKTLEEKKYISDGDINTVVVKDESNIKENINKKIVKY